MILKLRKGEKKYPRPTGERVRMRGYKAFTLAEILVTLGVIGVVAAMTLPSLIKNYQKAVAVSQLKKAYSDLNQALQFSEAEYGDINSWDWTNTSSLNFFNKYFSKYTKIKQITYNKNAIKYYRISGNLEGNLSFIINQKDPVITTVSGYNIIPQYGTGWLIMYIDINGYKKPNTFGKDVFAFCLGKGFKRFLPWAWEDSNWGKSITDRNILKNGPSSYGYQCNKQGRGIWCGALIMQDGWKIKDDYPW